MKLRRCISVLGPMTWCALILKASMKIGLRGRPLNTIVRGPRELLTMHRPVRFTDAVSNFGWSEAVSVVIAQIADRAIVDGEEIFIISPASIICAGRG